MGVLGVENHVDVGLFSLGQGGELLGVVVVAVGVYWGTVREEEGEVCVFGGVVRSPEFDGADCSGFVIALLEMGVRFAELVRHKVEKRVLEV